jgi:hypothetical protein
MSKKDNAKATSSKLPLKKRSLRRIQQPELEQLQGGGNSAVCPNSAQCAATTRLTFRNHNQALRRR